MNISSTPTELGPVEAKIWQFVLFSTLLYCSNLHVLYNRPGPPAASKFEFGFVTVKSSFHELR